MWNVYVVRCSDGSLYTGSTNNLTKRVQRHNSGHGGKYTRARKPVALEYVEDFNTKNEAFKRESAIKKLSKVNKERLIKFGEGHRFPSL